MSQDPVGEVIQNLFHLQQAGTGVTREARKLLNALFRDLAHEIVDLDPTEPARERYRRARVERLLGNVDGLIGKKFREVHRLIRQRTAEIGAAEGTWAERLLRSTVGSVAVDIRSGGVGINLMKAIIDAEPFGSEKEVALLSEWAEVTGQATVRRVHQQVRLGMARGETLDQIIRRVRGKSDGRGGFIGGVLESTTRDTEAVVRTAVNFISNRAHIETYAENADILKELVFTATLDGRTSEICMALDGRTTDPSEPDPDLVPPRHYRCRSVLVPVVDWEGLGIETPPEGMRASKDGPGPSSQTYEDWLRRQPSAFQDEVLGPGRAQLFRDGKMSLRDLVTGDQRSLSIEQLRKKAGMPPKEPPAPRGPSPAELEKTVRARELQIAEGASEWATAWNPITGQTVIDKTTGSATEVTFTQAEVALAKDAIFTHNHPSSSPFSIQDVRFAAAHDVREMRVASALYFYQLHRGESAWEPLDEIGRRFRRAEAVAMQEIDPLYQSGQLDELEASREYMHRIWTLVFGDRYRRQNR